jgi:TonB-dependent SusC/RagA subfamily outer membrane receptor
MLKQMYSFYPKKLVQPRGCTINILLVMNPLQRINAAAKRKIIMRINLTTLILITAILQVSASTYAQKITLSERNAPLTKIFEKISDQTGYDFLVSTENLKRAKSVTINVQNEDLKSALDKIFTGQPLSFVIQEKMVVVSKKEPATGNQPKSAGEAPIIITGKVTDTSGAPLQGATVKIKSFSIGVVTNATGDFAIENGPESGILIISYVGYQTLEIAYDSKQNEPLIIQLKADANSLSAVQVIGYGTTTKRLNTGSVSTITTEDIEKQPVTNILSALEGRMPGVFVQTTNGLPGGNINVQIRGKGSLTAGTNPLYVIDGVPFESASFGTMADIANAPVNGVVSPLNSLNPSDIESISVLKDADATAIYGSRGSNGVVLITTKKGKSGFTKTDVNVTQGISTAADQPKLLNLDQYLELRKEAFANDGLTPDVNSASDL